MSRCCCLLKYDNEIDFSAVSNICSDVRETLKLFWVLYTNTINKICPCDQREDEAGSKSQSLWWIKTICDLHLVISNVIQNQKKLALVSGCQRWDKAGSYISATLISHTATLLSHTATLISLPPQARATLPLRAHYSTLFCVLLVFMRSGNSNPSVSRTPFLVLVLLLGFFLKRWKEQSGVFDCSGELKVKDHNKGEC